MTKKANSRVSSGLRLSKSQDGASLSVTFHSQTFPEWPAAPCPAPLHQWAFVEREDYDVQYPKFTERKGHFAPYVRAELEPRRHVEYGADGTDTYVEDVVVHFMNGSPYENRFTILI